MLSKISETQRSMLLAAAIREDRLVTPPANARPATVKIFGVRLIDAGCAKEIKASSGAPVWRKDTLSGESYALKLSAKGLNAVAAMMEAADDEKAPSVPAAARKASTQAPERQIEPFADAMTSVTDDTRDEVAPTPTRAPRANSKLGRVIGMLGAEAGATMSELTAATGLLEHTTRAALTGL